MRRSLQIHWLVKFLSVPLVLFAAVAIPVISAESRDLVPVLPLHAEQVMTISSPSFSNGGDIPKKFTCDGADVSPQLSWSGAPSSTKSFALLSDDPDAPAGTWNHWAIWNIPANLRGLPEGVPKNAHLADGTAQGVNDFKKSGYNGPCPPAGKPHRYYFKLFALDQGVELNNQDAGKPELEKAMKGHILAQAEWMGRYKR